MPHVQIVGPCRTPDLIASLQGYTRKDPPLVFKVLDAFLSPDGRRLLLEVLVVEGYLCQSFFLLVKQEEGAVLLRCHPSSAVQKTDGVKLLIAALARRCLALCPGSRVGNTNLESYLARLNDDA